MQQSFSHVVNIDEALKRGLADARFDVASRPAGYLDASGKFVPVPNRVVLMRADTFAPISIMSEDFTVVTHREVIDQVEELVRRLGTPYEIGAAITSRGAHLRMVVKFTGAKRDVSPRDSLTPALVWENALNGLSRVKYSLACLRDVCTNLAVGGGGWFRSRFSQVHRGKIEMDTHGLEEMISNLDGIVRMYREWDNTPSDLVWANELSSEIYGPKSGPKFNNGESAWATYNEFTRFGSHQLRSVAASFRALSRVNNAFQARYPSFSMN